MSIQETKLNQLNKLEPVSIPINSSSTLSIISISYQFKCDNQYINKNLNLD